MVIRSVFVGFLGSCVLLPFGGCGGGDGAGQAKLVPAGGTIKIDGKAASGVMVTFVPTVASRDIGLGYTTTDGRYELKNRGTSAGVPAGEYKVTCEKYVMPNGSDLDPAKGVSPMDSGAKQVLPLEYTVAQNTPLKATVPPEGNKTIDFDLKSK